MIYVLRARPNIPSKSPEHEGIVLDILRIQGMGPFTRPARVYVVDIARTIDGTLWNDLPFLVGDMTTLWIKHSASMSAAHRLNFATFLTELASNRVARDKLCQVALLIFRALFESPQELRTSESQTRKASTEVPSSLKFFICYQLLWLG